MALIDTNDLKARLRKIPGYMDDDNVTLIPLREVQNVVDMTPTVEAVPVKYGRWKSVKAKGGPLYPFWDVRCSICGYTTSMAPRGWDFCPHCGAVMEGK